MVPDAEKIVSDYLRENPAVAAIVGRRVVGKTPSSISEPWVRLTQIDDPSVDGHRSDHLIAFNLQLDCYAGAEGGQPEATNLSRAVREALRVMPSASLDAVVTGVDAHHGFRSPDADYEPARERVIRLATVYMHS